MGLLSFRQAERSTVGRALKTVRTQLLTLEKRIGRQNVLIARHQARKVRTDMQDWAKERQLNRFREEREDDGGTGYDLSERKPEVAGKKRSMIQILIVCILPVSLIGLAVLIPWLLKRLEVLSADQKGDTSSSALFSETDVVLTELMTSCPSQSHHHDSTHHAPATVSDSCSSGTDWSSF